jgi:hypothetical protein
MRSMGGFGPWVGVVHGWVCPWVGVVHGWCGPWVGVVHGAGMSNIFPLQNMRLEYPWSRYKFKAISISAKMMPSKHIKRSQFCWPSRRKIISLM